MISVDVDLRNGGDRSYPIRIGPGLLDDLGTYLVELDGTADVLVVTDSNVATPYLQRVVDRIESAGLRVESETIQPGEESKSLETWQRLLGRVWGFEQSNTVVIVGLGGGVVGDVVGFVAASHRRGLPYVQVPTSLLAQTDCGVGGKVGVNYRGVKNLIGAFYQPRLVVMDVEVLSTLSVREFRAGLAEVVKYGVICDMPFFEYLETHASSILDCEASSLLAVVQRSCEIKAHIVTTDERDTKGERRKLNLGHTFGHAIEAASGFTVPHGEAVAIGIACACDAARELGMIATDEAQRIEALLVRFGLPTCYPATLGVDRAMDAMKHDKKFEKGVSRFVLPRGIGEVQLVADLDMNLVADVLRRRQRSCDGAGLCPDPRPTRLVSA